MARDGWRDPYVGVGADGARRSAEIDRSEADALPGGSDRWQDCMSSALAWERQAEEMEQAETEQVVSRQNVLDQWDVLQIALESNSAAQAAMVEAKRAEARTSRLVMEARYQLSLTVPCDYCGVAAGHACIAEPGVNVHRYPRQHGVRDSAAREIVKAASGEAEKQPN
jgi:hypothetical protein